MLNWTRTGEYRKMSQTRGSNNNKRLKLAFVAGVTGIVGGREGGRGGKEELRLLGPPIEAPVLKKSNIYDGSYNSLLEHASSYSFSERKHRGILPIAGYTGRLRPKGVPILSSQYIKR